MSREYRISELIMDKEEPYYRELTPEELKKYRKVREVKSADGKKIERYLPWVDDKNIKNIATPEGRELTPEELFDFVIGNNITDFAKSKNIDENSADIAIVLGNIGLRTTKERALKAFQLYKAGVVKKIIFTGGISKQRDVKQFMHPELIDSHKSNESEEELKERQEKEFDRFYKSNELVEDLQWEDLPEADWGAETFVPGMFDENYQEHISKLTEKFLKNTGINPEDVLTEAMSTTTQENAEFCKNIFESEEIETGTKIRSAILVTTCTHGSRAMRQFKKVFGDTISLTWCPSTLDLEQHESLKAILSAPDFDETAFREELKRIYCTVPELTQMLKEETANHRNAFILGDIDEPTITTIDREITHSEDDDLEL